MASRRSSRFLPRWLRHRTLIAIEAVLLVGAAKDHLNELVKASTMPNWGKVLFVMAVTVGLLGVLFVLFERFTLRSVKRTHDVVQAIPVPTPLLLVHVAALAGLFLLHAHVQKLPLW